MQAGAPPQGYNTGRETIVGCSCDIGSYIKHTKPLPDPDSYTCIVNMLGIPCNFPNDGIDILLELAVVHPTFTTPGANVT